MKVEIINKPFLGIISATRTSGKRRAMISRLPIRFAFFAVSAILLLSGFLAIHSNQSAWAGTFPGPNGQIAFVRGPFEEHEFDDIYVMNADGSGQTRLTDNTETDTDPSWSPDGEKIAFSRSRDNGEHDIYVMNSADGSGQTRLTDNVAYDTDPSWSPDGEKIAFVSDRDDNDEIYVMNSADGSGQTRLTNNDANDFNPSWSPDGEKIAFSSDRNGNFQIYVMNADGSGQTRLTHTGENLYPSWSPDGEKIAFSSDGGVEFGSSNIYVMNADGSGQTRLTDNDGHEIDPSWSPDGEKIAFVSTRDVNPDFAGPEIYIMNADDGSDVTRLTDNDSNDLLPDWGTNTSPPSDGTPTPSEQVIDEAISAIQNLDSIPQSLKTNLIALLRQASDSLSDDTITTTTNN